jgi:chemotaxis protein histidine kinase CheA
MQAINSDSPPSLLKEPKMNPKGSKAANAAAVKATIVSLTADNAVIGFVSDRLRNRTNQGIIGDAFSLAGRDDSMLESDVAAFWTGCVQPKEYHALIAESVGDISSRESNLATYRLGSVWRAAATSNHAMPEGFLATADDVDSAHKAARAFVSELDKAGEHGKASLQSTQMLFVACEHIARLVPAARAGQPEQLLSEMTATGFLAGILQKRRELMLAKGVTVFDTVEAEKAGVAKRKAAEKAAKAAADAAAKAAADKAAADKAAADKVAADKAAAAKAAADKAKADESAKALAIRANQRKAADDKAAADKAAADKAAADAATAKAAADKAAADKAAAAAADKGDKGKADAAAKAAADKAAADKAAAAAASAAKAAALVQTRVKESVSPADKLTDAVASAVVAALRAGLTVQDCHIIAGQAVDLAVAEAAQARRDAETLAAPVAKGKAKGDREIA